MDMVIIPNRNGLKVTFTNLSSRVPPETTFKWDFGDSSDEVTSKSPIHTYNEPGMFLVVVKATYNDDIGVEKEETLELPIVVTDKVKTTLSDTIYRLIDNYLPTNIIQSFPFEKKRMFIEKWQLYVQPLVNHEVPEEEYNNELWYEALENQLVMEAAILDYLTLTFTNMLQSTSSTITKVDETTNSDGEVKKIVTGPSEVEFFNPKEVDKDIIANITKAMQPGGFIETLRLNLCTLADRLLIILPFCEQMKSGPVVPRVVNRRKPTKYQGPNPPYPVNS